MIKKMMIAGLLIWGGSLWAVAQTRMTIAQLFERIEENSKSLRTSKSGVEAASIGIESAKSKKLPDLDASLSFSYIGNALMTDRDFSNAQGLKSPHFGNNFAFQAQQVVYAGGAINAGIRLAELGKQQAEVGVKLTRQQARFIALGQYLDLYKIDNRIKVYEKNIELTRQLIADIKAKQTQGMALKNDITRYELQMESLKLGLTSLRNNRSILNHQLLNTLGMNQEDKGEQEMQIIPDATIADKAYAKDGEAYWQTASTMNSPLLEQSSNAIRIAEQKEKIAKSDLLPKVALVAAENFDGPILFELPPIDKNLNVWYVGVGVKYSLSSLFKSNKRIRQAAVETRQAKESHALQAEQLNNSVQAAYVQYQQTYVELETQRKSVELAQQNYEVMNARYLSQLALVTDMVDASNLKLNAELNEVDARINIVYAYYRMKYVAGDIDIRHRSKIHLYTKFPALPCHFPAILIEQGIVLYTSQYHILRKDGCTPQTHGKPPLTVERNQQRNIRHALRFIRQHGLVLHQSAGEQQTADFIILDDLAQQLLVALVLIGGVCIDKKLSYPLFQAECAQNRIHPLPASHIIHCRPHQQRLHGGCCLSGRNIPGYG